MISQVKLKPYPTLPPNHKKILEEFPWLEQFLPKGGVCKMTVERVDEDLQNRLPEKDRLILIDRTGNKVAEVGHLMKGDTNSVFWRRILGIRFDPNDCLNLALRRLGDEAENVRFVLKIGTEHDFDGLTFFSFATAIIYKFKQSV